MIKSKKITEKGYEVVFTGTVTSQEMFEIGEDFKRHPNFSDIKYILMLFDETENLLIDADELRKLAEQDRKASDKNPGIRFAVATDSLLVFGLARMWEAFYGNGPWQTKIFKDCSDARKWLDI